MEAHLAPIQPSQVNKITTSCEICSGFHNTQYCMEDPEQAFVEYTSSRTDEAGDVRLSKFEADFKRQQSEMTNKIDTVLKAITDQIVGTLPSNTVKNPKLSTSLVLSARSYPTQDLQCSNHVHGSINAIIIHPKQPNEIRNDESEEKEHGKKGAPKTPTPWNDDEIEWLDVEEPLDLVNTSEESAYESLIKEMPKCSLNYDFRIKKKVTQETLRFPA
ncbi:hypothetical protein Tco_0042475 [Tanacetum coccineum]